MPRCNFSQTSIIYVLVMKRQERGVHLDPHPLGLPAMLQISISLGTVCLQRLIFILSLSVSFVTTQNFGFHLVCYIVFLSSVSTNGNRRLDFGRH